MQNGLTTSERSDIIGQLKQGISQNQVARNFRRSPATINKIAKQENILPAYIQTQKTKNANQARRYAKEGRLDMIEEAFDKVRELLKVIDKASQAREIATAIGILIDKYRLEVGESTSRSEILAEQGISDPKERLRELLHAAANNGSDRSSD